MDSTLGVAAITAPTPNVEQTPAAPTPIDSTLQTINGLNISTPAQGLIINSGTSTIVDPLVGNQINVQEGFVRNVNETVGSEDMTTKSVAQRKCLVWDFEWGTEDPVGKELVTGSFPWDLVSSAGFPARDALSIHEYFSGKALQFTVQTSANPFAAGVLQLTWRPSYTGIQNQMGQFPKPGLTSGQSWNQNNVIDTTSIMLNVGEGNAAILTVPLENLLPVLRPPLKDLASTLDFSDEFLQFRPEDFNFWGTLHAKVFNRLKGTEEDFNQLEIRVYAELIEPFMAVLRPPRNPIARTEEPMEHGAILSSVASAAMPMVEEAVTSAAAGAIGGAFKVGKECTFFRPINEDPMALNLAVTNDQRHLMTLGYDARDFNSSTISTSEQPPDTNFTNICSRRSRIANQNWDAGAGPTTQLYGVGITPSMGTYKSTIDGLGFMKMPNIGLIAALFAFWRGSITLTVEIVGNAYVRGALICVYNPAPDAGGITDLSIATALPHVIMNVAETRKVSIRIPYNSTTPWKRTTFIQQDGSLAGGDSMGRFEILVWNSLRTNKASAIESLDVNVYVHSTDMEFRSPYLPQWLSPAFPAAAETLLADHAGGNLEAQTPLPGAEILGAMTDPSATPLMPNPHEDILQLLTRRTPLYHLTTEGAEGKYTKITIPLPCAGIRMGTTESGMGNVAFVQNSFYNLLSNCYAWQTGSQVISLLSGNGASDRISVLARVIYSGDLDWKEAWQRNILVEDVDVRYWDEVREDDGVIAMNMSMNTRRDIGVPWYDIVNLLPSGMFRKSTPLTVSDDSAYAAYIPYAIVELFIKTDVDFTIDLATNVGPNFAFRNFLGVPDYPLFVNKNPDPPAVRKSTRTNLFTRTVPNKIPKHVSFDIPWVDQEDEPMDHMENWIEAKNLTDFATTRNGRRIPCAHCNAAARTHSAMIQHVRASHPLEVRNTDLACPFCAKIVKIYVWDDHKCLPITRCTCRYCPVQTQSVEKMFNHVKNSHPGKEVIALPIQDSDFSPISRDSCPQDMSPAEDADLQDHMDFLLGQDGLTSLRQASTSIQQVANSFTPLSNSMSQASQEMRETSREFREALPTMTNNITLATEDIRNAVPTFTATAEAATRSLEGISIIADRFAQILTPVLKQAQTGRDDFSKDSNRATAVLRAARLKDPEPILSAIIIEIVDYLAELVPVDALVLGLKGVGMLLSPGSAIHDTLNGMLLARARHFIQANIPQSWLDYGARLFNHDLNEFAQMSKSILILVAFGFSVASGLSDPISFFSSFSKNFSFLNIERAGRSLKELLESCSTLIKWFQSKFLGKTDFEGMDWLGHNTALIAQFRADYEEFSSLHINKILSSPILRSRVIKIGATAMMVSQNCAKITVTNNQVTTLKQMAEYFLGVAKQARVTPPGKLRTRPTVLTFMGPSQCGKTFLATTAVPYHVNRLMGWPQEPIFMISSSTDDFMSGYAQQLVTMIDDFLQVREGKDLNGFMQMVGNSPYRVNMASLEEKGTQFLSELVVLTMNEHSPKVDKLVTTPSAVYNRIFDHCVWVVPKQAYALEGGRLNLRKVREQKLANPDDYLDFHRQIYVGGVRVPSCRQGSPATSAPKVLFKDLIIETVKAIKEEERIYNEFDGEEPIFDDINMPEEDAETEDDTESSFESTSSRFSDFGEQGPAPEEEYDDEDNLEDHAGAWWDLPTWGQWTTNDARKTISDAQNLAKGLANPEYLLNRFSCKDIYLMIARTFFVQNGDHILLSTNERWYDLLKRLSDKTLNERKTRFAFNLIVRQKFTLLYDDQTAFFYDDRRPGEAATKFWHHFIDHPGQYFFILRIETPTDAMRRAQLGWFDVFWQGFTSYVRRWVNFCHWLARGDPFISSVLRTYSILIVVNIAILGFSWWFELGDFNPEAQAQREMREAAIKMADKDFANGYRPATDKDNVPDEDYPYWVRKDLSPSGDGPSNTLKGATSKKTYRFAAKEDQSELPERGDEEEVEEIAKAAEDEIVRTFFGKVNQGPYNAGAPKGGKVARGGAVPKVQGSRPSATKLLSHGDMPEMAVTLRRNMVRLSFKDTMNIRALGWKNDLLLVNTHFVNYLEDGDVITMTRQLGAGDEVERTNLVYKVEDVRIVGIDTGSGVENSDIAIWRTGWRTSAFRDISKHIVKFSDFPQLPGQDGYWISDTLVSISKMRMVLDQKVSNSTRPLSLICAGTSFPGLCGAPWIVVNSALFGNAGKICGLHSFGGAKVAGSVPICIEYLENTADAFGYVHETLQSHMSIIAPGPEMENATMYGVVSPQDAFLQPTRSEIKPSPVHDEIFQVTHEPSVMARFDKRLEDPESFLPTLLHKTDRKREWFKDEKEVEIAAKAVYDDLSKCKAELRRKLTLDEAINGVDGKPHWEEMGLEMRNSPGYPYNKAFGRGKYPYFSKQEVPEGKRQKWTLTDPTMIARVEERIELAKRGKVIADSIWLDCMKDELRPRSKIATGNTRLVVAPPLDLMIIWNIYFGGFRAMFMDPDNVGVPTESALGVDPDEIWPKWGIDIKQALRVFGIDYEKFDASQHSQWYTVIVQIINLWYQLGDDWTSEDDVVRRTMYHEVGHTLELFQRWLFQSDGSLPSGVPGGYTTITNILVNKIMSRIAFIRTGLPIALYPLYIQAIFLGDDNVQWIKSSGNPELDRRLLAYNRKNLASVAAEVGMKVTMPDKSPELTEFDTPETITFLKRGFSDFVIPGYYLPTIDPSTIMNLINWFRPKHNPNQFYTNVQDAVRFSVPHGKKFYDEFRDALLENETIQLMIQDDPNLIPPFDAAFAMHYLEALTEHLKPESDADPILVPKVGSRLFHF